MYVFKRRRYGKMEIGVANGDTVSKAMFYVLGTHPTGYGVTWAVVYDVINPSVILAEWDSREVNGKVGLEVTKLDLNAAHEEAFEEMHKRDHADLNKYEINVCNCTCPLCFSLDKSKYGCICPECHCVRVEEI